MSYMSYKMSNFSYPHLSASNKCQSAPRRAAVVVIRTAPRRIADMRIAVRCG